MLALDNAALVLLAVCLIGGIGQLMMCEEKWFGFTMMGILDRIRKKRGSYFEGDPVQFAHEIAQEKWPLLKWEEIWWQDTVLFFHLWVTHFFFFAIPAFLDALDSVLDKVAGST